MNNFDIGFVVVFVKKTTIDSRIEWLKVYTCKKEAKTSLYQRSNVWLPYCHSVQL